MTTLDLLERRREQVLLSCDLQRATLSGRIERIERHGTLGWAAALLAAARLVYRSR